MSDELLKSNLHYDELNKIRILDPVITSQTIELKENCKEYEEKVRDFESIINMVISTWKELSEDVDKKKMAAIGITNLLKTMAKDKEREQMKLQVNGKSQTFKRNNIDGTNQLPHIIILQAAINEKTLEIEHLDTEYDSLQLLELAQQETIEYLTELH